MKRFNHNQAREHAHSLARDGIATLARAFNRFGTEDVPYRYTRAVQDRFFELGVEISRLIEHGDVEVNPAHELYRRTLAARSDEAFQSLLKTAIKRRRTRKPVFKGQSS